MVNLAYLNKLLVTASLICAFGLSIMSQNAGSPKVGEKPLAIKIMEIGRVSTRSFHTRMEKVATSYDPNLPLCIINYGSVKEIARRERLSTNSPFRWPHHRARITLVRGGRGNGPKTVVWEVPVGADDPEP